MAARTTTRVPMPIKMRAKQFAMFDALKGLTEAIAEKEQQVYPRKELSEERIAEINQYLKELNVGDYISLVYYCWYGRQYRELRGQVSRIETYWRVLQVGEISIAFNEIFDISKYD